MKRAPWLGALLSSAWALASAFASPKDAAVWAQGPCALHAKPLQRAALPRELEALAGAFFHPGYRGVFDVGTYEAPAFYDPREPYVRLRPPAPMARVQRMTAHFLIGPARSARAALVAHRSAGVPKALRGATFLQVADALETADQTLWILGATVDNALMPGPLMLFRGDNSAAPMQVSGVKARISSDSVLGATSAGDLAVVWVDGDRVGGRVSLWVRWIRADGRASEPREVDSVALPASYVDLCLRTGTNLVVTPDEDALAIAWRPLIAVGPPKDTGSRDRPPGTPFEANVRILGATPAGVRLTSQHRTTVQPLPFVTGHGPWGLDSGDAWALSLDGRAVVMWLDASAGPIASLVAARPSDPRPTVLLPDAYDTLVAVHSIAGARATLYTYRSSPEFRAFEIGCRP